MPIRRIVEQPAIMNKLIIESMSDGVWTFDEHYSCTFINDAALTMLGYTRDQCLGKNMHSLIHYKDANGVFLPQSACRICQTFESGKSNSADDGVFWKSDGSGITVRYTSNPVYEENKLIGVVVLFNDITALKKKESEILKIKNDQENLINTTEDLIWSVDADLVLMSFNRAYANRVSIITGRQVAKGTPVIELEWGQGVTEKWERYYNRALSGERLKITEETFNPAINDMEYDLISFVPMYGSEKEVYGVACYSKNITEEVNSRKSIADAYSDLKNIFNQSIDIICTIDMNGCYIKLSAACLKTWGYSPEELAGKNYTDFVYHEDILNTTRIAQEIINGKEITHFENRYVTKSGQLIPMLWSAKWDSRSKIMYCIARNNKDKKTAEEKLTESEAFLKEAQRLAKMGSWKFDFRTDKLTWSEELYNVFDTDKSTFLETHGSFIHLVDEKDRQFVQDTSKRTQLTGEPFNIQYSITTSKGEKREIEEFGYGEKDKNGIVIRLFGTAQNITERKKAEEKIREANQRFTLVSKATFDTIWDWDLTTNTFYWGDGFELIFGHGIEGLQIDPSSWTENIHSEDYQRVMNGIYEVIKGTETNWLDEYRFRRKDESYAYVLDKGVVIRAEDGKPIRMVGAIQDITKRKEEEHRLKLLESVITNTNDAVIITQAEPLDEPGPRIVYVNEAFTQMTGYTAEDLTGKTPRILQGPRSDAHELDKLSIALRSKKSCETTVINYKKNGEEFWVNFTVNPVANDKGICTHFVAIERDITERKKSEIQLRQLNESLQKQANDLAISNAELEQFAFIASHDLQEPLRMVSSFLTQLEKKYYSQIDDKGKQYIYFAVDGAKRMRQIILDLLEYSRVGRTEINPEETDLEELIDDVLALYKKTIEETQAKITKSKLPALYTDKPLIRQIFQNLIGNSLKYHKEGVHPEITIAAEDVSDYWLFSVADNGIGIEQEYFDQIFIIFKRLHNREVYPGTGMGLAITKKIVENMGGKIWVTSEMDRGSRFNFLIPKKLQKNEAHSHTTD